MIWFYLDDERKVPAGMDAILVSDCESMLHAIDICNTYNIPFGISFDHDLGDLHKTGYGIALYIVENQIPMRAFHIHTANPVGAFNIRQLLSHYGYEEKDII